VAELLEDQADVSVSAVSGSVAEVGGVGRRLGTAL
jgi:hypothetical protein